MKIREATEKDLQSLIAFYDKTNRFINERTGHYNPDNPVFPSTIMIENAIIKKELLVGIVDDEIIIACIVNHDCDDSYRSVHWISGAGTDEAFVLHALRILPEFEGCGYARKLLEFIIEYAEMREQKAIRIDVLEGYSAEGFYLKFGFEYIDTVEIFYEDIGKNQRFRLLEKVIDRCVERGTEEG